MHSLQSFPLPDLQWPFEQFHFNCSQGDRIHTIRLQLQGVACIVPRRSVDFLVERPHQAGRALPRARTPIFSIFARNKADGKLYVMRVVGGLGT